jgi:hypothetical protein
MVGALSASLSGGLGRILEYLGRLSLPKPYSKSAYDCSPESQLKKRLTTIQVDPGSLHYVVSVIYRYSIGAQFNVD